MKKLSIKKVCRFIATFIGGIAASVVNLAWMLDKDNACKVIFGVTSAIFTAYCFLKSMGTKW